MAEKPMLGGCCVCLDERGWAENPLVYCDGQGCSVAVHQACYGIVKVPSGPWFCRKCESQERAAKVKCELCPHRDGALKRTDSAGWAHVVCALYIPEVTFGSVSTMEPIILQKVPADRFNKTCYLCEEENRSSKATSGACMTCAKQGCKASFHVTCAQMAGLLCEEASSGNQTKYCGYCKVHLAKGKKASSAYKNLSSTKVYKLPMTSSSDELTSPERSQACFPETTVMKPGDIRYTKAGKKRSKSLEENLAAESCDGEVTNLKYCADTAASDVTKKTDTTEAKWQTPSDAAVKESENSNRAPTEADQSIPVTSSEDASKNGELAKKVDPAKSSEPSESATGNGNEVVSSEVPHSAPQSDPLCQKSAALTLSSLAEAASVVSQSSTEPGEEALSSPQESVSKKSKISAKDQLMKKKYKENIKKSKMKKGVQEKKRKKAPLSGIMPHRPVPPPITSKDPVSVAGTAVYPRHSVVSLAKMGLDRTETYEAHEIGDNNKIFKPDFSIDGVTALEQLQKEQREDTSDFFLQCGATPEVSTLMEALQKVREDNSRIESAIRQMARRRDQLHLIKTRLLGLQMSNVSVATSAAAQHNNVGQHQINPQVLPSQSVPTPQLPSSPHLSAPNQHQQS